MQREEPIYEDIHEDDIEAEPDEMIVSRGQSDGSVD